MASFSTLFLLVVLPALLATALGDCNYEVCYNMISLIAKDDQLFCNSSRDAVNCAEKTLVNNPDCADIKEDIDAVVSRVKKIIHLYCGGNSVSISSLTLCFGLVMATYFSRSK